MAVIIVGGNIAHLTRVMTTAIALETAKGDLALALALALLLELVCLFLFMLLLLLLLPFRRLNMAHRM